MSRIKIGIIGLGNCASSLIQGLYYYSTPNVDPIGLMHTNLGGYRISDIEVVLAIDVDARKVGKPISEAIYSKPNCTTIFAPNISLINHKVIMGIVEDGVAVHTQSYDESVRVVLSEEKEPTKKELIKAIKESGAEMLVNYLPVGSKNAAYLYADIAIEAGVGFINCMPVFIASDKKWAKKFQINNVPCIGDDIKSQLGATIVHRELMRLFEQRGIKITHTYQINTGGNTDFLNMLDRNRLSDKKISKTTAVQSNIEKSLDAENIHVGPSDYVQWQQDNKVCFLRIEGKQFGDIPMNLELRLSVEDSPNSAGVVIDAIRCMKLALDRRLSGEITEPSTYFMKHPMVQMEDFQSRKLLEEYINRDK